MIKYLHEHLISFDDFHAELQNATWEETMIKFMTIDRVTETYIEKNDLIAEMPVKSIKTIKPYRGSYYYAQETMPVYFHEPYNVYDEYVRVSSKDLISIINRKKKFQMLKLTRKRRYFYITLSEE